MREPRSLSEHASKQLLASYGVPVVRERLVHDAEEALAAADAIGYPVVAKLCGEGIAHKTERGLVRLSLSHGPALREAAHELLALRRPEEGNAALLVAEQVEGRRELLAGLVRDPQFGPCVVLGLGGILTEALQDVAFACAPLSDREARRMIGALRAAALVTQPFRGEPPADQDALAGLLVGLGRLAAERPDVLSVDVNPLILRGAQPVAVDALVVLAPGPAGGASPPPDAPGDQELLARFRPLFEPRGIAITGVSNHPGKFGFVAFHNLLRFGYRGEIFPVKPDGAEVLGRRTLRDLDELPDGRADLVFLCTPNRANVEILRASAAKGVRAAFVASAGYGEAGEQGRARESELVEAANELGMVVAGPNGQGVINTALSMCAQIVAPCPPPGRIAVVNQSGNLVSSFLNYAVLSGIGVSKALSCGNSAQTGLADYLEYFAADPETDVVLAYVEGVRDGAHFRRALARLTASKPLVLVRGGVAAEGQRAALSHTGSLASDDRVFEGLCRQCGVTRAPTIEQAFEWAASFATQPLPRGPRTVVFTTAGGWGVLAADACARAGLELIRLPDAIRGQIDGMVPSRWSRNNPIDLAGGETRDTVAAVLDLVCAHPEVDAVVHLGLGIQAAEAHAMRSGPFYAGHGLERIVCFHESQDERYARAAREASERHGKPVLTATELVHADRDYGNAGPVAVKQGGRLCHPSAHRAVEALAALWRYAAFRREG